MEKKKTEHYVITLSEMTTAVTSPDICLYKKTLITTCLNCMSALMHTGSVQRSQLLSISWQLILRSGKMISNQHAVNSNHLLYVCHGTVRHAGTLCERAHLRYCHLV